MTKVLIIEDQENFREMVSRALTTAQMEVIHASDAEAGIAMARTHAPDLILSDINMDGENGFYVLGELRKNETTKETPFILMTGLADKETMRHGMILGADDYLIKPFSYQTLLDTVNTRLAKHKAMRRQIEESKARLVTILEATPDFIGILSPDGKFREINRAGKQILGLREEERADLLALEDFRPYPRNPERTDEVIRTAIREGVWRGETILVNRLGDEIYVSQVIVSHRAADGSVDYLSTIARDISDAKRNESALRLFERAVAAAGNGILITDAAEPRHPVLYANPAFERMSGFSAWEVMGRPVESIYRSEFYPDTAKQIKEAFEQARECHVISKSRRKDGMIFWLEISISPVRDANGRLTHFIGVHSDITAVKESEEKLRRSEELFSVITGNATDLIAIVDRHGKRIYNSPSYQALLGYSEEELNSTDSFAQVHPEDRESVINAARKTIATGRGQVIEYRMLAKDGNWRVFESHGAAIRNAADEVDGVLVVARDITERKCAEVERNMMEVQLRQAQKLESIGQLAAGIAHEINTPTQFIGDNNRFLQEAFGELNGVITKLKEVVNAVGEDRLSPALVAQVREMMNNADMDYLLREIPVAIRQSQDGIERVAKIVRAMKEFSHPGTQEKVPVDINHTIDCTLTVARNAWKYVANVERNFDPNLPAVPCLPGELNQVILNLIINAADAIGEANGGEGVRKGTITISTRRVLDSVEIRIGDTGAGIPESVRSRIFDPFFTTKPVGKGTGQGLAIARSVVVDKHSGVLSYETEVGKGTTFIIQIPLKIK